MAKEQAIDQSVGLQGANRRHDVMTVQVLLNNHASAISPRPKLSVDGVCGHLTMDAITAYQQRVLHMVHPDSVIFPGGRTLKALLEVSTVKHRDVVTAIHQTQKLQSPSLGHVANVTQAAPLPKPLAEKLATPEAHAPVASQKGHKYTDSPLEMVQSGTLVNPLMLPDLLQKAWPQLNANGARLITAQYMGETTGGKHCWNYNLGNVKATREQRKTMLHQYLGKIWEPTPANEAARIVKTNPNARYATPAEIIAKVGHETVGTKVVFYTPPDIQTCFRAYTNLGDGVIDWTNRYKRMVKESPKLLTQLNEGDYAAFAAVLKKAKYYTADESKYAASMKRQKEYLDSVLGKK